ncbi:MAG: hypothetical protein ABSB56_04625 [Nitrososphaerales archaeon]|jgi:hypothetical protein
MPERTRRGAPEETRAKSMRRPILVVAVLTLLGASAVFALLGLCSPLKSFPATPTCGDRGVVGRAASKACIGMMAHYKAELLSDSFPIWLYQSFIEIAEGLSAVALILALFMLKRPRWSWLDEHLALPRLVKYLGAITAVSGGLAFVTAAVLDWRSNIPSYTAGSSLLIGAQTGTTTAGLGELGARGLAVMLAGICGFILFNLDRGIWSASRDALLRFAAPLVLFLEVGLLVFAPLSMFDHAVAFLKLQEGGIQPLSNWFVLIVSASLTLMGIAPFLSKSARVQRTKGKLCLPGSRAASEGLTGQG